MNFISDSGDPIFLADPTIFYHNGVYYLYGTSGKNSDLGFEVYVSDFSEIKPETLKECIVAEDAWENTKNVAWPVAEGPSILKHDSVYYFIYSTNDFRNPDYAVGYATSDNPFGPWNKSSENPIFTKTDAAINGTGHGDFFFNEENELCYVLHTHRSDQKVSPRRTALVKLEFRKDAVNLTTALQPLTNTFYFLQQETSN